MAPHSSTLAWKIPWMEEPGGLQSMGSLRVGQDGVTSLSFFTFLHWRRKWQPNPVFLPGESQGRGAWWAAVYGVAQSRTRLKRLSSSSSSSMSNTIVWFPQICPISECNIPLNCKLISRKFSLDSSALFFSLNLVGALMKPSLSDSKLQKESWGVDGSLDDGLSFPGPFLLTD